jgi:hypothetical protein
VWVRGEGAHLELELWRLARVRARQRQVELHAHWAAAVRAAAADVQAQQLGGAEPARLQVDRAGTVVGADLLQAVPEVARCGAHRACAREMRGDVGEMR